MRAAVYGPALDEDLGKRMMSVMRRSEGVHSGTLLNKILRESGQCCGINDMSTAGKAQKGECCTHEEHCN